MAQGGQKDPAAAKAGMFCCIMALSAKPQKRWFVKVLMMARVKEWNFPMIKRKVDGAIKETYKMEGITFIKVWLNEGYLEDRG